MQHIVRGGMQHLTTDGYSYAAVLALSGRIAFSVILAVLTAGCDSVTGPAGYAPIDARPYTVGAALANLDEQGRFQFPDPQGFDVGGGVSQQRARELAIAAVYTLADAPVIPGIPGMLSFRESIEREHGGPVDWERIEAGPRVFNIESHLLPLPDSLPMAKRRFLGPHYAVPFLVDDMQVAVLSVSALATNVLVQDGRIKRLRSGEPGESGGEFHWSGVGAFREHGVPVSPEAVARFLFDATGAKVREVPIAARVSGVYSPYDPRWVVVLDRTVELLAPHDSSVVITDTVHVAWACPSLIPCADGLPFSHMHMFVPAVNPPAVEEIPVPQYDGPGRSVGIVWMSFPIKATMPTILVPVVPRPE